MPSPHNPPDANQRPAASADFEWPPRDELSIHPIRADDWRRPQDAGQDGALEGAAAAEDAASRPLAGAPAVGRHPWRGRWPTAAIAAAALVAAAAGWRIHLGITEPLPAEAAPPLTVVTVVPIPPPAAAPLLPGPTIRVPYPVDPPRAGGAPEDLASTPSRPPSPWPATSGAAPSAAGAVFEAVGEKVASRTGLDPVSRSPASTGDALASTATAAIGAAPSVPVPSPAAVFPPAALIRGVLTRYEAAYDRGDVDAAATVWPSLDRRALSKAFASLDRQDVDFERCAVDVDGGQGSAVCDGTLRYVPGVGRGVEKSSRITWTFALARSGDEWRITGLQAR